MAHSLKCVLSSHDLQTLPFFAAGQEEKQPHGSHVDDAAFSSE